MKQIANRHTKKILRLWSPLAAMWIVMGIELPFITAIISRMPDAKPQLAAFGLVFAVSLIIESPIIQLLTAGTALSTDRHNYRMLIRFMHFSALLLTAVHLLLSATPLFRELLLRVMNVPDQVADPAGRAFLIMVPWAASVGYRRLWQGVLIRYQHTGVIPLTMLIRLAVLVAVMFIGFRTPGLGGAETGALALSLGAIAGALAARVFVHRTLKKELPSRFDPANSETPLQWGSLIRFYIPLALTSFIALAARPILSIGLAWAPDPLESLAVWPVIMGLLFVFNSLALSYQEVVVALLKGPEDFHGLRRFAVILGGILGLSFMAVALSPAGAFWFDKISGLPSELLDFTNLPIIVLAVTPFFYTLVSWYRGVQVSRKNTPLITKGIAVNTIVLLIVMSTGILFFPFAGVISASLAMSVSFLFEAAYLKRFLSPQTMLETAPA